MEVRGQVAQGFSNHPLAGSGPSNQVTPSPTTNRLTDTGYAYDANGNMTNDGANTLSCDGGKNS